MCGRRHAVRCWSESSGYGKVRPPFTLSLTVWRLYTIRDRGGGSQVSISDYLVLARSDTVSFTQKNRAHFQHTPSIMKGGYQ